MTPKPAASGTWLPALRVERLRLALMGLAGLAGAAALCAGGTAARAAEQVPFELTNQSLGSEVRVHCVGPWLRSSKFIDVNYPDTKTFYTAKQTAFSMFGVWSCTACEVTFCDAVGGAHPQVNFCLEKEADQKPVELTLAPAFFLTVNYPAPSDQGNCSTTSATATLGDSPSGSGTDRDSYLLEGLAGDALTLRLEGDGETGQQGDLAVLRLIAKGGGFRRTESGKLPLTLSAVLPKNGSYLIEVRPLGKKNATPGSGESGPLRGAYQLTAENAGGVESLVPTADVEP